MVLRTTNWYVARFQTAASTSTATCAQVIDSTVVQTSVRLVNFGRNHAKTATSSATESVGPSSRRQRGRGCRRGGAGGAVVVMAAPGAFGGWRWGLSALSS